MWACVSTTCQESEQFWHYKVLSCFLYITILTSLSPLTLLALGSHSSVFHFWNFVISKYYISGNIPYVCNLSELPFFTQPNSLEICPNIPISHSFSLLNSIPSCACTTVYSTIYLLKDKWADSSFRSLQIKQLLTLMYRFSYRHKVSFPCNKC